MENARSPNAVTVTVSHGTIFPSPPPRHQSLHAMQLGSNPGCDTKFPSRPNPSIQDGTPSVQSSIVATNLPGPMRQSNIAETSQPSTVIISQQESGLTTTISSGNAMSVDQGLCGGGLSRASMGSNSSSVSEISVACLQDRIMQMEESHHSTNEELQATLQELTDLQEQVGLLQLENEQLEADKAVLYESLCRQTEKLEECRSQIVKLRQLLIDQYSASRPGSQSVHVSHDESHSTLSTGAAASDPTDRELHWLDLLRAAQKEQQELAMKNDELTSIHNQEKLHNESLAAEVLSLKERAALLESTIETLNAEKKRQEELLIEIQQRYEASKIETSRLKVQLETEQKKAIDLQKEREAAIDASDLEKLLRETRNEKQQIENKTVKLEEQVALLQLECTKLRDQLLTAQEDLKVARNNRKKEKSDFEYQLATIEQEKVDLMKRISLLEDSSHQSEIMAQRHLEDKRELKANINDLQQKLANVSDELSRKSRQLEEIVATHELEVAEWNRFQQDLLTVVRVANDFKMEAAENMEKMAQEKKELHNRVEQLEKEIKRLKCLEEERKLSLDSCSLPPNLQSQQSLDSVQSALGSICSSPASSHPPSPLRNPNHESRPSCPDIFASRSPLIRGASQLSVKALIESIESTNKQAAKMGVGTPIPITGSPVAAHLHHNPLLSSSRSSSSSSINSLHSNTPTNQVVLNQGTSGTSIHTSSGGDTASNKSNETITLPKTTNRSLSAPAGPIAKVPVAEVAPNCCVVDAVAKAGQAPSVDVSGGLYNSPHHGKSMMPHKIDNYSRRNSLGDLSEKKDPLNNLVKGGGSKRNALLKWCQQKTTGYKGIDITNFSSSWNDGLAFCALLHSYLPDKIPYDQLDPKDKKKNFTVAFQAAESVGIPSSLNVEELISQERPDWHQILAYVTSIYRHFET